MLMTLPRSLIVVVAALAAGLGATVAGFAASQSSSGVIHACYSTKTGGMRRVSATAHCKSGERALKWNVTGLQGSQGLPGSNGTNGTNGTDGVPGLDGTNGTDGTDGTDGTTIVRRIRLQTPTNVQVTNHTAWIENAMPLANATWTQNASELDQVIGGSITVTTPTSCDDGGGPLPSLPNLGVTIKLDGMQLMFNEGDAPFGVTHAYVLQPATGLIATPANPNQVLATLFEPDVDTSRTITVSVRAGRPSATVNCNTGVSVSALSLDVTAMR